MSENKIPEFKGIDRRSKSQCDFAATCGIDDLNTTFSNLLLEMKELKKKVESLESKTEDLISAWATAKGVTAFVKWIGSLAVGMAVIFAILKGWIK